MGVNPAGTPVRGGGSGGGGDGGGDEEVPWKEISSPGFTVDQDGSLGADGKALRYRMSVLDDQHGMLEVNGSFVTTEVGNVGETLFIDLNPDLGDMTDPVPAPYIATAHGWIAIDSEGTGSLYPAYRRNGSTVEAVEEIGGGIPGVVSNAVPAGSQVSFNFIMYVVED